MDGEPCVRAEFTIIHMVKKKPPKLAVTAICYTCLYKGECKDLPGEALSLQGALASKKVSNDTGVFKMKEINWAQGVKKHLLVTTKHLLLLGKSPCWLEATTNLVRHCSEERCTNF